MSNKNPNNKFGWLSSDFQEEKLSEELPEELLPAVVASEQEPSIPTSNQNPSPDQTSINTNNLTEDKMQKNTTKNIPTKNVVTKNVPTKNIPAKNTGSNSSLQQKNTRSTNTVAPATVEEPKSFGRDGKRSNPGYKLVGVQLSVSLHRKAKEILLQQGEEKNFSDLINELLEDWINGEN